jgi:uncharacterized protein (DUF1800 family)
MADPWAPYTPDAGTPWTLRRVVHLHRRAGFAATWSEVQRDLADGPRAAIDRLLAGKAAVTGVPREFATVADGLADAAADSGRPERLKAWWLYRMLFGPDPLGERLTLLWHNHFATSNLKVNHLTAMRRQNDLFRGLGRGPFGKLLRAVVRDPALLWWLDAPANRKGHPNENLARELMELFTLGIGHYRENDVKEAARAFTGWTVENDAFAEVGAFHDAGEKTILKRRGKWTGADLVTLLLEHPATAGRLAWRICDLLLGEGAVPAGGVAALADGLRSRGLDVGWAVATVLQSRAFFADGNLSRRVQGPVEFVVGAARALELFEPASSTLTLAAWTGRLGQDLFYPPNVGGWPGGRSWLTTRSLIGRANFAAALVAGREVGRPGPLDALGLARRHGQARDRDAVTDFYTRLLLGREPTSDWRKRLAAEVSKALGDAEHARRTVTLMLALPEGQLA